MDYMTNIMAMSDAKSVCYIGPFLGGTADVIWKKIKPLGKELYLVDNYLFIPESKREHFFSKVKDQIDPDSERIHTVLASSHDYDWTKHDFVFLGHHDIDHMRPDLDRLVNSDVKYAVVEIVPRCFQRLKAITELLTHLPARDLRPLYYLNGLVILGRQPLHCDLDTTQDTLFGHDVSYMPRTKGSYLRTIDELKKLYQLD